MGSDIRAVTTSPVDGEAAEAEFELTVLPEADHLYGLALAIVGDPAEAEDIVQETMTSAWRAWKSVRDPGRRSAWLTRICINHAIRRRRLLHRRILWSRERWGMEERLPAFLGAPLVDLRRAFRSLSVRQRAAFVLHHVDGYTLEECAHLLGCRPGTARSHLGRAITKLRRELADV
jgi:RNA polymerase sigma-70 factor (ECF subfamily)